MVVKRLFEGLFVVTVGVILLGNTTGVLPWTLWWTVLMLWPLLLVSAGIDILGKATHSTALRVLASVLVLAGLIYGAAAGSGYAAAPPVFAGGALQRFTFSQPATSNTVSGEARIETGLARLTVRPGDVLASASGFSPFGKPDFAATTGSQGANVRISSSGRDRLTIPAGGRSTLDVTLDRGLFWQSLRVDGGVSDANIDLSDMYVGTFEANLGLSNVVVTFGTKRLPIHGGYMPPGGPPPGQAWLAKITGGLSTYRLRVPRDLGVELVAENGLGSINVHGDGWERTGGNGPFSGRWRTQGYDSAASKLRLEVNTGLSSVDVERF